MNATQKAKAKAMLEAWEHLRSSAQMARAYPCNRCNMDEGSPVCLQDDRCPRNQSTGNAPCERSVADIPDAELLRRVVRSVARNRPRRKEFAWAAVSEAFGLGSTYSAQLCARFGLDPDTGAELERA